MSYALENFFAQSQNPIASFIQWIHTVRPRAKADHLGYKCETTKEFQSLRSLFEKHSTFIYQSIVSGRRIAIIKMQHPIPTPIGDIYFLELADQKPDQSQKSGFDHIEIYPIQCSLEELNLTLSISGLHFQEVLRPHHRTYDAALTESFKIRLEPEPLIQKIISQEMI